MPSMFTNLAGALALAATVSAHGYIVSPPPRVPGAAMEAACGSTIYNNQASDKAGPVQLLMQSESSIVDAAACNLWQCKGYQFDDNTDNVQTYSLGETVPFEVNIVAPHTGSANVSIVNTRTNTVVGEPLISWDVYASTSTGVTANDTNFEVTIPAAVDGCTTAGECVLQWYWYAPPSVDQAYEGCVDFVIGDGAAAAAPAPSTPAETSAPAASSAPASSAAATVEPVASTKAPVVSSAPAVPTSEPASEPTAPATPAPTSIAPPAGNGTTTTGAVTAPAPSLPAPVPTTLQTVTRPAPSYGAPSGTAPSGAAPSGGAGNGGQGNAGGDKTPEGINRCLDEVNACIAKAQAQGTAAMSACEQRRSACY